MPISRRTLLATAAAALPAARLLARQATTRPAFAHPGILHTREQLARIKFRLAAGDGPWRSGFDVFKSHPRSRADYKVEGGFELTSRGPGPGENIHHNELWNDANAAYQNALMFALTGQELHARKPADVLDA